MKQIAALTMVSLILGLGISTLDQWTAPEIAQSREEVRREAIQRVLPSDAETITVLPPRLQQTNRFTVLALLARKPATSME